VTGVRGGVCFLAVETSPPASTPRDALRPRFATCVRAIEVAPDATSGAPSPSRYRRCPGGVIADVDCPEFAGLACRHHVDRGVAEPSAVSRLEHEAMALELSVDYLTPRYRRRLRALVAGADALDVDRVPTSEPPVAPREHPTLLRTSAPVNVPADRTIAERVPVTFSEGCSSG